MHTTPSSVSPRKVKMGGPDGGVERALDNVMRSLKGMAMGTPRWGEQAESRWSSSSEGSVDTMTQSDESGGFWRPRKSGESTRSKITLRSVKSNGTLRSTWSRKKGRKSEDEERMEVDEAVPPVPDPVTPRRSRRMLEGLAKSLGLTPRKKKAWVTLGSVLTAQSHGGCGGSPRPTPTRRPSSTSQVLVLFSPFRPRAQDIYWDTQVYKASLPIHRPSPRDGLWSPSPPTTLERS